MLAPVERCALLGLARAAIEGQLRRDGALERRLATLERTSALEEERASFVTLELADARSPRGYRLRGCVGSLEASGPLYRGVIENAGRAAFQDPRFPPLTLEELPDLSVSLSILSPLVRIDAPSEIVVERDGVSLEKGTFRSVFLPEVAAEQGWDVVALLENLAQKAGLARDGWKGATLRVFRTETLEEE